MGAKLLLRSKLPEKCRNRKYANSVRPPILEPNCSDGRPTKVVVASLAKCSNPAYMMAAVADANRATAEGAGMQTGAEVDGNRVHSTALFRSVGDAWHAWPSAMMICAADNCRMSPRTCGHKVAGTNMCVEVTLEYHERKAKSKMWVSKVAGLCLHTACSSVRPHFNFSNAEVLLQRCDHSLFRDRRGSTVLCLQKVARPHRNGI